MIYRSGISLIRRTVALFLVIVIAAGLISPLASYAEDESKGKTVRVGCFDAPYFITDEYGRRSGYSYDYQCKLAAYNGWEYEYVEGSFSELLQMLMAGEIDLLSDVSYLDERADKILYSSVPMGTESYCIFVPPGNSGIKVDDLSTLNGKRVGVARGTFQEETFGKWAEAHGVEPELVELRGSEEESLKLLGKELDALVTMDVYADPETAVPVARIGSSDFYFAVSRERADLLPELDAAMNSIQEENAYYSVQLHDKYLSNSESNLYLPKDELDWLSEHGKIRVGYQDNYLAFCAKDPKTGELTGALKDFLEYASGALENATIDFEATAYPTAGDAMEALKKGEIDFVFPANLTEYDSEELGVVMSPALMTTEMDAVVRESEQKEFIRKEDVVVAVNEGNTNYDMFLADHYPGWKRAYFADTPAGLEAVAAGDADCVIISNYRYSNISKQCEKLHLDTVYTGVNMDYCIALRRGDVKLYSILARTIKAVPDATIHTALTYYSTEDVRMSIAELIRENLVAVLLTIAIVLLIFTILLLRSIRMQRKAIEEEQRVNALSRRVYVDPLTSVRNKGAFNNYLEELQKQLENNDVSEFAIGVFDCDDLKKVNDRHGHDKGDLYLVAASQLICKIFQHSPVFRIGGDEFAVVMQNDDYKNRDELVRSFREKQNEIAEEARDDWEKVSVAVGVAVYDPEIDHSVNDTARRADKIMYENKRAGRME